MSVRTQRNSLPLLCLNFKVPQFPDDYFLDDFDDEKIGSKWTKKNTDANRTIVESGEVLTISVAAATAARWFWINNEAPTLYQSLISGMNLPVEFTTKINNFVLNNHYQTGIFIGYHDAYQGHPSGHEAYLFGHDRADTGEGIGIKVRHVPTAASSTRPSPGMPTWFKIRVAKNEVISFWYSADGDAWTQQLSYVGGVWIPYEISGFFASNMDVGLFAQSLIAAPAGGIIADRKSVV